MKKTVLFAAFLAAALTAVAQAKDDVVCATGVAAGYRAAVNEALVSALEQHDGITVSSTERQQMTHADSAVSTRENGVLDDVAKLEMKDAIVKSMQKWAKGKILGYEVISESFDPVAKKHRVELSVRFPGRYVVGRDPNTLRRMAVAPFRVSGAENYAYGDSGAWASVLADRMNELFTQSRKFTMLDRKFDAEVNAELNRTASGNNASSADYIRLNQKLGTDYLVAGEINFLPVNMTPIQNPLTGQTTPAPVQVFAEIKYRVILVPTGQLKCSDTVQILTDAPGVSGPDGLVGGTAKAAAAAVTEQILSAILPLEIVGKTSNGQFVIGQGWKTISVGDMYIVYGLGETVSDTRTGEILDEIETELGIVQIVRVSEKVSYAVAVSGEASTMAVGSRLRRYDVPPEETPAEPAATPATTLQIGPGGAVVSPLRK